MAVLRYAHFQMTNAVLGSRFTKLSMSSEMSVTEEQTTSTAVLETITNANELKQAYQWLFCELTEWALAFLGTLFSFLILVIPSDGLSVGMAFVQGHVANATHTSSFAVSPLSACRFHGWVRAFIGLAARINQIPLIR